MKNELQTIEMTANKLNSRLVTIEEKLIKGFDQVYAFAELKELANMIGNLAAEMRKSI